MEQPASRLDTARRVDGLVVAPVGRLATLVRAPGFALIGPSGDPVPAVTGWLLDLAAGDRSPQTLRAYALSLLRFFRFLWAVDHDWRYATDIEVRDFVLWARTATKLSGNKHRASPRLPVNRVTGKSSPTDRYSAATINHTLSSVREFYAYVIRRGEGPPINPIPDGATAAHHNPDDEFVYRRRARFRQKEPQRAPRAIPDQRFDDLFKRLGNNRDRALAAFYVSSGARATELLSLTGDMINYGDQLIGVIRKGGSLQWLPVAPDAMVWLRLYQLERGTPGPGQPVWLTRREPFRPLTYDAFRAVMARVNQRLGTNWSIHDLRHTFAIRALDGGVPLHELQQLLGHASLITTTVYAKPRPDDVIAHYRAVMQPHPDTPATGMGYDGSELATVFGEDPSCQQP